MLYNTPTNPDIGINQRISESQKLSIESIKFMFAHTVEDIIDFIQ